MIINSLKLNDFELMDEGMWQIEGLFDMQKDVILNQLARNGSSFGTSKIKERKIQLQATLYNASTQFLMQLNQLVYNNKEQSLKVNIVGMPAIIELKAECENISKSFDSKKMVISLIASSPYLYSTVEKNFVFGSTINSSLTFPFTFPIVFGDESGGSIEVNNEGTCNTYPFFEITGTCSNMIIENATTNEVININYNLQNDTIYIDNNPISRGIYLSNGDNLLKYKTGPWIKLIPGKNQLVFTRTSNIPTKNCTVKYKECWI